MNKIRFIFSALFVALLCAPAHAEPISLTSALVGALLPSLSAASVQLISTGIVLAGTLAASAALGRRGKRRAGYSAAQAKETVEAQEAEEINAFGRVRISGALLFGNTDDYDKFRLVAHFKGRYDVIEKHYLNGSEVILYENGAVASPPWVKASNDSFAFIYNKNGDQSLTAWSALKTAFPSLWTDDHRCNGVTQTLLKFVSPGVNHDHYLKLYSEGVPKYEMLVRANPDIYDPRTSNTMWTDNGVLIAAHYIAQDPSIGVQGIAWDVIAAEADKADALVATKMGTEKRARAWGVFASEEARKDVIQDILDSIGAEATFDGEKHAVRLINDLPTSDMDLIADDIVRCELAMGPEAVERPNRVRVKYYSPERNYELSEIDLTGAVWSRIDEEITKYGEKLMDIELRFCPSASQAQRIARRMFAESRAETGVLTTNMIGVACWQKRVLNAPDLHSL